MLQNIRERRRCQKWSPYIFFAFEITAYSEIAYIGYEIFSQSKFVLFLLILFIVYRLNKSFERLFKVKARCKDVKNCQKYQKSIYI